MCLCIAVNLLLVFFLDAAEGTLDDGRPQFSRVTVENR